MSRQVDWDAEAAATAQYVGDHIFEAHRGVMPWHQVGVVVVFGNDGYMEERTKEEVRRIREALERLNAVILGFGVDPNEGYSWALLIKSGVTPYDAFEPLVTTVAVELGLEASGYQATIAPRAIKRYGTRPTYSEN